MGILRFLLAISVVVAHAGAVFGTRMVPGNVAVETFFMISGFYMSLILSGKYAGPDAAWKFYSNRYLRLYPTYLIILCCTWLWFLFAWWWMGRMPMNNWAGPYEHMSALGKAAMLFSNWTMFGQDLSSLFHFSPGQGFMLFHYYESAVAPDGAVWAGEFRTIGQAWSIGLEIWFYLLAPALAKFSWQRLVGLALACAVLKAAMEARGFPTYFFFPAQLEFFLAGMLAQRYWQQNKDPLAGSRFGWWVTAAIAGLTVLFPFWGIPGQRWIFYGVTCLSLPLMFACTRKLEWDRWVGNLSYPVYMVHILVVSVVSAVVKGGDHPYLVLAGTLVASAALLHWVEEPLDAWRQRRLNPGAPPATAG